MIRSIITNNCYGTQYYTDENYEYKTPFIGLFLFAPCYINFLENYNNYINKKLLQINKSKYGDFNYPIGKIGTSEIHFLHEKDFAEAKSKWDRRKKRLDEFTKCIIKMCDRDVFDENILQRFLNLDHPRKILFISKKWNDSRYKITDGIKIVKTEYQNECSSGYQLYRKYPLLQYLKDSNEKK
jgi:uncharacterized protein (DUF1919 family)|tara:strand:- start:391 stop:939 length:549 start_codon:yes stop_codon:yes gene_type:complete